MQQTLKFLKKITICQKYNMALRRSWSNMALQEILLTVDVNSDRTAATGLMVYAWELWAHQGRV
jgi:hypothetical protein